MTGTENTRRSWRLACWGLVAAALLYGAWHAWGVRWMCDDAYISVRYAGNLADGHGLIFNPGAPEERVEGFSNPSWTLLLALGLWMGVPEVVQGGVGAQRWGIEMYAALLGMACWVGLEVLLLLWSRRMGRAAGVAMLPLAAVAMALHHHWATLCLSGLETGLFTLLLTAMAWRTATAAKSAHFVPLGVLAAVAALTRPDGAILAVVAAAWSLVMTLRAGAGGALRRAFPCYAIPALGIFLPLWVWKWSYYGSPVPNTALAKSAGEGHLERGLAYVQLYLESYLITLLALGAGVVLAVWVFARRRQDRGAASTNAANTAVQPVPKEIASLLRVVLAYGLPYLAFVVWVGGDFMHTRFLLPITPLVFLLMDGAALVTGRGAGVRTWRPVLLVVIVAINALADRRPEFLDDYTQPVSDNRRISFAPYRPGASGPMGNSRIQYIRQCGLMLRDLCRGLDVRVAVPGGAANLAHYGDFPVTIEMANGLTDRFIASLGSVGSDKVGHDRSWRQFPGYLQQRGVDLCFDLSWRAGDKIDEVKGRTVVLAHPDHPGVEIEALLVTWQGDLLAELQRRSPLVRIPPLLQFLDAKYLPALPGLSDEEVRKDFEAMQQFYFDHTEDPVREAIFRKRLGLQ